MRCGKCAHEWFALHPLDPEPVATQPVAEPLGEEGLHPLDVAFAEPEITFTATASGIHKAASARARINPKPFRIAVPVLAVAWLALAFVTYFPSWSQSSLLSGVYRAVGAVPLDGLVFADVGMQREQEGSKTKFILTGSIRNYSSMQREVPTVRVLLKDKENKTIWGREYPVHTTLKAGEVYPFRIANVETSFAGSVSSIVVDMGNSLQLLVR